jgi:hypothetical protein
MVDATALPNRVKLSHVASSGPISPSRRPGPIRSRSIFDEPVWE